MRDEPVPVKPEYTPAGPGAESQRVPDNPPPRAPESSDDRSGDDSGGAELDLGLP